MLSYIIFSLNSLFYEFEKNYYMNFQSFLIYILNLFSDSFLTIQMNKNFNKKNHKLFNLSIHY